MALQVFHSTLHVSGASRKKCRSKQLGVDAVAYSYSTTEFAVGVRAKAVARSLPTFRVMSCRAILLLHTGTASMIQQLKATTRNP